jgi:hypothetical protein
MRYGNMALRFAFAVAIMLGLVSVEPVSAQSSCFPVSGAFRFDSFTFTSATTATGAGTVEGDITGTFTANYFNISQSGDGAIHMNGVHEITDLSTGGTFTTFDRLLLLPDQEEGWGRPRSTLRIVEGSGGYEGATGRLQTNGRVNLGTLEGTIEFKGRVCVP